MSRKTLGIISGMGTRAGLLFVNKLIDRIEAPKDQDFPEFILHNNSQIPDRTLAIVYGKESPKQQLVRSLEIMQNCATDYVVSTCITSFFYLNQLDYNLTYNILNPIDLLLKKLEYKYAHIKRIGLLATTGTIHSGLFHETFKNSPFELIILDEFDQEEKFMKSVYMKGGFKSAHVTDDAHDLFQASLCALKEKNIDLLIGGCTEVQIGLSRVKEEMPCIDLVDVLVDAVIEVMNLKSKVYNANLTYNG